MTKMFGPIEEDSDRNIMRIMRNRSVFFDICEPIFICFAPTEFVNRMVGVNTSKMTLRPANLGNIMYAISLQNHHCRMPRHGIATVASMPGFSQPNASIRLNNNVWRTKVCLCFCLPTLFNAGRP